MRVMRGKEVRVAPAQPRLMRIFYLEKEALVQSDILLCYSFQPAMLKRLHELLMGNVATLSWLEGIVVSQRSKKRLFPPSSIPSSHKVRA